MFPTLVTGERAQLLRVRDTKLVTLPMTHQHYLRLVESLQDHDIILGCDSLTISEEYFALVAPVLIGKIRIELGYALYSLQEYMPILAFESERGFTLGMRSRIFKIRSFEVSSKIGGFIMDTSLRSLNLGTHEDRRIIG